MRNLRISSWSIILAAITSIFSIIVFSKKVYFLLHPKMHFICKIAIVILIILFLESVVSNKRRYKNIFSNIIFMIPITLGLIYITSSPYMGLTFNKDIQEHSHVHDHIKDEKDEFLKIYGDMQHGEITIGEKVHLQGIITGRDEKYISKVVMSCCAADSQLVGIRIIGKIDHKFHDKICEIEGSISKVSGELVVKIKTIKKTEDISNIYIYR